MTSNRWASFSLGLAITLAGLVPGGMNVARGAELPRYVSSDFCAAVVIHPERISKSTLALAVKSALPKQMTAVDPAMTATALGAALGSQTKLPPGMDLVKLAKLMEGKAVIRIVVLIDPLPAAMVPAAPGIIVQFGNDI